MTSELPEREWVLAREVAEHIGVASIPAVSYRLKLLGVTQQRVNLEDGRGRLTYWNRREVVQHLDTMRAYFTDAPPAGYTDFASACAIIGLAEITCKKRGYDQAMKRVHTRRDKQNTWYCVEDAKRIKTTLDKIRGYKSAISQLQKSLRP